MGGSETFDSLTDLVEHFKKTGIEEASGAFVYLRQVRGGPGCLLPALSSPSAPRASEIWKPLTSHPRPPPPASHTMPHG